MYFNGLYVIGIMARNHFLISVFGYIRGSQGKIEKILDLIRNQKIYDYKKLKNQSLFLFFFLSFPNY